MNPYTLLSCIEPVCRLRVLLAAALPEAATRVYREVPKDVVCVTFVFSVLAVCTYGFDVSILPLLIPTKKNRSG